MSLELVLGNWIEHPGTWEEQKSFVHRKGWVGGILFLVSGGTGFFPALNLNDSLFISGGGGGGLWFFSYGEILQNPKISKVAPP